MSGPLARPHAVYRILGPAGLILYIGKTKDLRARLAVHKAKNKDTWWPLVVGHEAVWYPTHEAARVVETADLRAHRPICNPVIPDASGKHVTVIEGRTPVRSLWQQLGEEAASAGLEPLAALNEAVRREVDRLRRQGR